ncbi:MAG: undecaprenyldiphospho-muramoylpentapeptide beta-N-acetylglucosaminyltransferase [Acidobacteria bacterium]|nr:undecaprenyldiphospho-muramoylpentapeptide beta-N-acetylglucosaminyltransferase [Acidobacteriota bacterium]
MKLLIAGGGTGGHVFPAIAVAQEWLRRESGREVLLVGTERGLEMKLVPQAGLPLETIRSAGLKGIGGMKFVRNLAMLGPSMLDSASIVRRNKFVAAFGVGGYASGPMMLAAALARVPTVIFEPNAEPGFTNRVLAGVATRIATAYEATAQRWGKKATVTGIPVRKEFFNLPPREPRAGRPLRLLITGGSQGALPINRAFVDAMDLLAKRKNELSIVHQTGERDYNAVRVAYARREILAEVAPFISNMAEQFARADLIVCRSGAITVAEVAAAGRAAIFIPFAGATDRHQLRNAQALVQQQAARLIPQSELTPERLTSEIFSLLDTPEELASIEQNARTHARPRAVEDMVDLIDAVRRN